MSAKTAGLSSLMILVAEVTAIVIVPTVNVMAVASTAATLPWKGRLLLFFLAGALVDAGALVESSARLTVGTATSAAATRENKVILAMLFFIVDKFDEHFKGSDRIPGQKFQKKSPGAFGQHLGDVLREVLRQQRQGLPFGSGQIGPA